MFRLLTTVAAAALAALAAVAGDPYKVRAALPEADAEDTEGAMAYLVNFDTGDKVDSTLVADNTVLFNGMIDEPFAARIIIDGARYSQFIVEPGSIVIDASSRKALGSPLNDRFREINEQLAVYPERYRMSNDEAERQAIFDAYCHAADSIMLENIDNPIGYLLFIDQAYEMEPDELVAFLSEHPSMGAYRRVDKLVRMNERRAATGEGSHYLDFEIDGAKLSDYVGRDGKYLLVDFFASWCRPCREQIGVIKEIIAQHPDGLNVLGVAVWDEPDDTRRCIAGEEITWDCIINAQSVPTDLYGISGIPCIMLIAPDGTIVSRDKQGDDLKADVDRALGATGR